MESFTPTKAFQVLYDFEGTNERELTVASGEILLSQGIYNKKITRKAMKMKIIKYIAYAL